MEYLLILYVNESGWPKLLPAEQEEGMAAYMAYTHALAEAGALRGSNRLRPSATATTVTTSGGKMQVVDGPFTDSKEQFAGYFLIDVPNLDNALSWAARCPATQHGSVEVRPVWSRSEQPQGAYRKERER